MITHQIKRLLYLFVGFMILPQLAWAQTFYLESRTVTQVKRIRGDNIRFPANEYLSLHLDAPKNTTFDFDVKGYALGGTDSRALDLYQAMFHVEPSKVVYLEGGRQWLLDGFNTSLFDGLKIGILPESLKVGFAVFGGVPRYVEAGDARDVIEGLLLGLNVFLRDVPDTAGQLSLSYSKVNIEQNNIKQNDTVVAGLSMSHQFSKWWATPAIYSNFEFDMADATVQAGSLGLDFYPHWRFAFNIEGSYYDVDRTLNDTTLFEQFVSDEIFQAKEGFQVKITKGFRFFHDFAYNHYSVNGRGTQNSYVLGSGLGHYWEKIKLSSSGEFYFGDSWGGTIYGALFEWTNNYFKKLTLELSCDISRYAKITGQNQTAVSFVGGVGYDLSKYISWMLGGEYNHNNWFDNEGRATFELNVKLDNTSQTKGKKKTSSLKKARYLNAI